MSKIKDIISLSQFNRIIWGAFQAEKTTVTEKCSDGLGREKILHVILLLRVFEYSVEF